MDEPLRQLLLFLTTQSLLAIGGLYVVLAELHRVIVSVNGWMTDEEFTALFAVAQASPGPNMLFVTLIGWKMAGVGGGIAATTAFIAPAVLLAASAARMWNAWGERRWFRLLRRAFVPLTVGLMLASAWLFILSAAPTWQRLVVVAVAAALSLTTRLPPIAILAAAAAAGALGFA
ncbi:MAG: chromate transporter [Salinarimonadaceae bacterium]|nr:MAG: chromate transporter [Salinarimonadaceae bacterium]